MANCKTEWFLLISDFDKLYTLVQIKFRDDEKWFGIASSLRVEMHWVNFVQEPFLWKGIHLKNKLLNEWKTLILVPPKPYKIQWGPMSFNEKNHKKYVGTNNKNVPIVSESNFWNLYNLPM